MSRLYAGTSGFAYAAWKPEFYPQKLAAKDFLKYYATRLNAVEINYTFRQLPKAATLENWVTATPEGFLFACKLTCASRISIACRIRIHRAVLQGAGATSFGPQAGSGLFQLPPNFKGRLCLAAVFLAQLPDDISHHVRVPNATWLTDEVYRLLERHRVALCLAESDNFEVRKW